MRVVILIFFISKLVNTNLIISYENQKDYLLKEYLKKSPKHLENIYSVVAVLGTCDNYTRDISSWFISNYVKNPVIIGNDNYKNNNIFVPKAKIIFCFIEEFEDIQTFLTRNKQKDFWYNLGYFHFIITKEISKYLNLRRIFVTIWENFIVNFVLVFIHDNKTEVLSYNPFNKTIYNYTKVPLQQKIIFPNKLKNLYKHTLRVAMFNDFPRNFYKKGKFHGRDATLLELFTSKINATLKYIITNQKTNEFKEIHTLILTQKADFSFIGHFQIIITKGGKFSYPRQMDDIVVVVKAGDEIPKYLNMVDVFSLNLWLVLIICFISVTFLLIILNRGNNCVEIFLQVLVLSLITQLYSFKKLKQSVQFLLIFWSSFSLIICTLFQSILTSVLVDPNYYSNVKSLSELNQRGWKVCLPFGMYNTINISSFSLSFIPLPRKQIVKKIQSGDTSYAYALPLSYVEPLLKNDNRKRKIFSIVDEHLIPGYRAYYFHPQSPYIEAVNDFLLVEKQFVYSYYEGVLKKKGKFSEEILDMDIGFTVFQKEHFYGVFMLLTLGYLIGIIIFFSEMILIFFF